MRIIKEIEIEGKHAIALFDTGSIHTYVVKSLLKNVPIRLLSKPYEVGLGGKVFSIQEHCSIQGKIEGWEFHTEAIPIENLGKVNGKVIDVIIGALTMEEWEITPYPKKGILDISGLKRRIFIEYFTV
jgi:hypothetical protein